MSINRQQFEIPRQIRISDNDLIDSKLKLSSISYSGSLMYHDFVIEDFNKDSVIYQYYLQLLKENNFDEKDYYVNLYLEKEWYHSIVFRKKNNKGSNK